MKATFLKGVVLGSVVSVAMLTATAAFGGTGPGGVFNLGKYNGVNATTALAGTSAGSQLSITNASTATGATGLSITVHSNKPPFEVNSTTKVPNLNADRLDGLDSSNFQRRTPFAVVNGDGTLKRGSAGTTTTRFAAGLYQVTFPQDISACAYSGTVGGVESSVGVSFDPAFIAVGKSPATVHSVTIITWGNNLAEKDSPFHLVVAC